VPRGSLTLRGLPTKPYPHRLLRKVRNRNAPPDWTRSIKKKKSGKGEASAVGWGLRKVARGVREAKEQNRHKSSSALHLKNLFGEKGNGSEL